MATKPVQLTFTPAQQAVRARLATLNPTQFVALTSVLQQVASAVDIRIAQLDAERARLADQKSKLSTLLTEFSKPSALDKDPATRRNEHPSRYRSPGMLDRSKTDTAPEPSADLKVLIER
jgi:hypothetical protein